MPNDAVVTVRIPRALKQRLEARAAQSHRSVSAQVLQDLESIGADTAPPGGSGRFLGLFTGARVATDGDLKTVRRRLWRRLDAGRARG